jgi:hypothetical protein
MAKITNKACRAFVQAKQPFQADNIFAVRQGDLYVVYSYGQHWPLFIYSFSNDSWLENKDRYSVITSKHRSCVHPLCETVKASVADMRRAAENVAVQKADQQTAAIAN